MVPLGKRCILHRLAHVVMEQRKITTLGTPPLTKGTIWWKIKRHVVSKKKDSIDVNFVAITVVRILAPGSM